MKIGLIAFGVILSCLPCEGQIRYNTFEVDGRFGVVGLDSLQEIVTPVYAEKRWIYGNLIGLGNDSLYRLIDMADGTDRSCIILDNAEPIYHNSKRYWHTHVKDKSVMRFNEWEDSIVLSKKYSSIKESYEDYIWVGKGYNSFDVFTINNQKQVALLKNIDACYYFNGRYKDELGEAKVLNVFYGNKKVHVYNSSFRLIKLLNKRVNSIEQLNEALLPLYTFDDYLIDPGLSPGHKKIWEIVSEEGERIYYYSSEYRCKVSLHRDWEFANSIQSKVVNKTNGRSFSFGWDSRRNIPELPYSYQHEMDFKIEN